MAVASASVADQTPHRETGRIRRRSSVLAVVAVVTAAIGLGTLARAATEDSDGPRAPAASARTQPGRLERTAGRDESTDSRGPLMGRSVPLRLIIPSVHIDTTLLRLGLNADGSLQVPWKPLEAGWYTGSPTPGQLGPAIIAGHVDSWATGPAVFYHLGEIDVGARMSITRTDSTVAHFRVTAVTAYRKTAFPLHQVYGDVNRAELRLITCAHWNATTQEYDDDLVVYAQLV